MPVAAVPAYLQKEGQEFYLTAPPGHRFLLYFAAWGDNLETDSADWRMKDRVPKMRRQQGQLVQQGWDDQPNDQYACIVAACKTPAFDEERPRRTRPRTDPGLKPWLPLMNGLATRQSALAATVAPDNLLRLDALATAPFTTGLGNEHPLENGFAFLNPYGLPYLPGSGVKGVLRQAARELATGEWGDPQGWDAFLPSPASGRGAGGEGLSAIDAFFGKEDSNNAQRGALVFWDVIPQIKGDSLMVEIMTPHQGHYYQQKEAAGSISPHNSGQPIPISYLTVPPGSGFAFHVVCDLTFLGRIAPALTESWKALLTAAFEHAFQWLGFGAKTAVGYGAMQADKEAAAKAAKARKDHEDDAERARQEAERQARLATLTPNLRLVDEFRVQAVQRAEQLGTHKDKPNTGLHSQASQLAKTAHESNDWSADEKRALAQAIEEWLPKLIEKFDRKDDWKEVRKKLKLAALKGEA